MKSRIRDFPYLEGKVETVITPNKRGDRGTFIINNLDAVPRGMGLGRRTVETLVGEAQSRGAREVVADQVSKGAEGFYRKMKFRKVPKGRPDNVQFIRKV